MMGKTVFIKLGIEILIKFIDNDENFRSFLERSENFVLGNHCGFCLFFIFYNTIKVQQFTQITKFIMSLYPELAYSLILKSATLANR